MTLIAAIGPFCRAFYRVEIDYNEGWNIYNAEIVAAHGWLYPVKYGWTSNNYPMLSFAVMAGLHRLTHEYLFTARMVSLLSLLCSAGLVGAIVHRLCGAVGQKGTVGRSGYWPAVLAALFTVALFCADADVYVGSDDPQMLAQVFFLAGLYVYLATRRSVGGIAGATALFVVGGFIKHNPVDFPLAVLIDLALISRRKAVWFSVCGLALLAVGVALSVHFGGPHFLDQILALRRWSVGKAAYQLRNTLGPILLPVCVAIFMAARLRKDESSRIAAIFLASSLLMGAYFGGGEGVSMNSLFDAMLATAILLGLFLYETEDGEAEDGRWNEAFWVRAGAWDWFSGAPTAATLFAWLFIPLIISGNWNVVRVMRETSASEARFDAEVGMLAARSGTALCESLLRCHEAGKPYIYDPCNATRLIQLGRLDQKSFVQEIRARRFGAIQLDVPPDDEAEVQRIDPSLHERFTPEMLEAIRASYVVALKNEDGVIYVPASR
jgi:putative effector of murein hydrolase LrgA (UPF0299 family)